jgi:hypothetical protein
MSNMGLTIAELGRQADVAPRTIQGWLTEGRHPRPLELTRVENIVGSLVSVAGLEPERPATVKEAIRRLRAAEREIAFAREILNQLDD